MNEILFVNYGGIGDQIHSIPLINSIKEKYPDSKLTLLTEPRSRYIVDIVKNIDDITICDIKSEKSIIKRFFMLFKAMKKKKYDIVISSGSSPLVSVLLFVTGIKKRVGYANNIISKIMLTDPIALNMEQYAGYRLNDLAKGIGMELNSQQPHIEINDTDVNTWLDGWLKNNNIVKNEYILIHPGISNMARIKNINRTWKLKKWIELISILTDKKNIKVVLYGGPDDKEAVNEIIGNFKNNNNLINGLMVADTLRHTAVLIKNAKAFVCVDSGPMNLGVAIGANIVALFGPTDENIVLPKRNNILVVRNQCDCAPCLFKKRKQSCDDLKCMDIKVEDVLDAIDKF